MRITDRRKGVIRSGGEWISPMEIENLVMEESAVELAACIAGVPEYGASRPVLFAVPKAGADLSAQHILARYQGRVAKRWISDKVVFVEQIPMTGTGKIRKAALRMLSVANT